MRRASPPIRAFCAALLALLLATRLLSPAGFMPAFEQDSVTIVACPDYEAAAAPMAHHHHGSKKLHQACPYAAGSAPAAAQELALLAALLLAGSAPLLGRTFRHADFQRVRERPPLRGPPLPA